MYGSSSAIRIEIGCIENTGSSMNGTVTGPFTDVLSGIRACARHEAYLSSSWGFTPADRDATRRRSRQSSGRHRIIESVDLSTPSKLPRRFRAGIISVEVATITRQGPHYMTLDASGAVPETPDALPVDEEIYDVTIIGGGPVGLFGAFYAGMRQMKTKIIDSLPELGGQLNALYPEKYIYDMPGFPKVLARDLAHDMAAQGTRFGPTVCLDEKVLHVTHEADETITLTTQRAAHRTRTVIIATGAGAFSPTKLNTPGVEEFEGRGVHYFVREKAQFAGKRLLIV